METQGKAVKIDEEFSHRVRLQELPELVGVDLARPADRKAKALS